VFKKNEKVTNEEIKKLKEELEKEIAELKEQKKEKKPEGENEVEKEEEKEEETEIKGFIAGERAKTYEPIVYNADTMEQLTQYQALAEILNDLKEIKKILG